MCLLELGWLTVHLFRELNVRFVNQNRVEIPSFTHENLGLRRGMWTQLRPRVYAGKVRGEQGFQDLITESKREEFQFHQNKEQGPGSGRWFDQNRTKGISPRCLSSRLRRAQTGKDRAYY